MSLSGDEQLAPYCDAGVVENAIAAGGAISGNDREAEVLVSAAHYGPGQRSHEPPRTV